MPPLVPLLILSTLTLVSPLVCIAGSAYGGEVSGRVLINSESAPRAVVYLHSPNRPPISSPPGMKKIRQENLRFRPDFLVVPAGTTIQFENNDDEIHSIYSKAANNRFDTGAHLPGTVKDVVLKNPGVVPLRCHTHQNMRGLIYVSPSPYFSVTDDEGRFEIQKIPAGAYRIDVWHPRLTAEESAKGEQPLEVSLSSDVKGLLLRFNAKSGRGIDLTETPDRDWTTVVKQIHAELERAIVQWKKGNATASTLTVMSATSKYYEQSGLREKIAQVFGSDRAQEHENRFDDLRKKVQGIREAETVTEDDLQRQAGLLIDGLAADAKKMTGR